MVTFATDPIIGTQATDFALLNHHSKTQHLSDLTGDNGIFIGFSGDLWNLNSVRHVLWLQRHTRKLAQRGINTLIIVPNESYELNGFMQSIPRDIPFPLLADPSRKVYDEYEMNELPGFVLIDADGLIKHRWFVKEGVVPSMRNVIATAERN